MEHRLDTLAKTLSGTLSRREIFRRLGSGLGAAVLVSLGLRTEAAETFPRVAVLDALGELPAPQAEVLHTALRTQLAAAVVCCGFRTKAERHQHGGSQPDSQAPDSLPARERSGQRLG